MLQWLGEAAVSALILIGAFFLLVGSYALAKLPDTMRRLHGPTKAATLGIGVAADRLDALFPARARTPVVP